MIRVIAAAILLGAGVVTVACGDPEAQSQLASTNTPDSTYTPTGETTRLRVEAVASQLACDGQTHDVRIWLDDLAREPEPAPGAEVDAGAPNGVYAFQMHLTYDPAVVWVAAERDIRIPDELTGDAGFTPSTAPLDNTTGDIFFGAISLVPNATPQPGDPGVTELIDSRIDPFATGEPILLATVGLTAMGEGATELSLRDVTLFANFHQSYAVGHVVPARVEVVGDCDPFATATPYPTPTGQAPAPSPSEAPEATPAVVTPVPAAGIRDDCPQGWAAITNASLSMCFPHDWRVTKSDDPSPANQDTYSVAGTGRGKRHSLRGSELSACGQGGGGLRRPG